MNQIINNVYMKHLNFETIDDVNKFRYMTRTLIQLKNYGFKFQIQNIVILLYFILMSQ